MDSEALQKHLEKIFNCIKLNEEQKNALQTMYTKEIRTEGQTCFEDKISIDTIQDLINKGLVLKSDEKNELYPIPLSLLIKHPEIGINPECYRNKKENLKALDKWMNYPFRGVTEGIVKKGSDKQVVSWLFDLLTTDWENVYCFGDYESFIKSLGPEVENEWIKERIKRGRKASVIATKDGEWAQRIHRESTKEMRKCAITPKEFSELFIMAFPEIQTTVMGGIDGELTFIHSGLVADQYANLVNESIALSK